MISTRLLVRWRHLGLTDEELEEERLHEMEKVMQQEAEMKQEQERVAAEEALSKTRRQDEWVRCAVCSHVYNMLSSVNLSAICSVVSKTIFPRPKLLKRLRPKSKDNPVQQV